MARKYWVEDYYTQTIEDIDPATWLKFGQTKMGIGTLAKDVKLLGVRCWPGADKFAVWHRPEAFAYGKTAKANTQTAMKDGFVQLRFSYTRIADYKTLPI